MAAAKTTMRQSRGGRSGGGGLHWLPCAAAAASAGLHYAELLGYNGRLTQGMSVAEQKVASLKTENAFYYSYYEETVVAPTLADALWHVVRDRRSEAPDTINALERFNVYQELLTGLLYRCFCRVLGQAVMPDPWYFFRRCSFALNAIGQGALVLLAALCGGGGLRGGGVPAVTLTLLLFLHRQNFSRVHDVGMLNLRENWALPVIWCQVLCLHRALTLHPALRSGSADSQAKTGRGGWPYLAWMWGYRLCTVICILLWQFSAFAFLLQVSAVFLCTLLACSTSSRRAMEDVVTSQLMALVAAAAFLFGNELLVHHMLVTQCVAIWAVLRLRREAPRYWLLFWLDGLLAVAFFGLLRLLQSRFATAEEHIGELFTAKVRQLFPQLVGEEKEPSFNARLYLAVSVFDFIDRQTIDVFWTTAVYPLAIVGLALWAIAFARRLAASRSCAVADAAAEKSQGDDDGLFVCAAAFSRAVLLVETAFLLVLGCFISRLKVLGIPLLLVVASSALAPGPLQAAFGGPGGAAVSSITASQPLGALGKIRTWSWRVVVLTGLMGQLIYLGFVAKGMPFLEGSMGSLHRDATWSEGESGDLFHWMVRRLPAESTIVASMPLSAEMRLHTPFRFVIHPQFESRSLRDRVQDVYVYYQCTSPKVFVDVVRKYGATHFLVEYKRCSFSPFLLDNRPELNCKKGERPWEDLFCAQAHRSPHFDLEFANAAYALFRIRDTPASRGKVSLTDIKLWKPMLDRCMAEGPEVCPSRAAELAVMFHTKLGQPRVGEPLLDWVKKIAPKDGLSNYVIARFLDYDLGKQQESLQYYQNAVTFEPNNPLILREYLMLLDVALKDKRKVEAVLRPRRHGRSVATWANHPLRTFSPNSQRTLRKKRWLQRRPARARAAWTFRPAKRSARRIVP
eukprot:TRINITY_DN4339_c0_g2_i1.p1 TRINITY_DN4339_c0_g2~~TRINITY_DN4339_c0_g2_i1.p1  ORF type:complete len:909 (+),score=224.25 TRINITY_DN4339_c0_g2_i1:76-2802(+)